MIPYIFLDFMRSFSYIKLDVAHCPMIASAKDAIYKTIMEYHKVSAKKVLQSPDLFIQKICELAAKILLQPNGSYIYGGNVPFSEELYRNEHNKTQFNFRASWLRTTSLCLDSTQENVMRILPYLLYCYTLNSSKNKIDCFDPKIDFTLGQYDSSNTAFKEIFLPNYYKDNRNSNNLRRNVKSLCNNFFFYKTIFLILKSTTMLMMSKKQKSCQLRQVIY